MALCSQTLRLGIAFFILSLYISESQSFYSRYARSNQEMVQILKENGVIESDRVEQAMLKADRRNFMKDMGQSYTLRKMYVSYGNFVLAPQQAAFILETLASYITSESTVLDAGTGTGWLTTCFAYMGAGKVYGVEHITRLADIANLNVRDFYFELFQDNRIEINHGDEHQGWPLGAPYKAIYLDYTNPDYPEVLLSQLANGGRLMYLESKDSPRFIIYDKDGKGNLSRKEVLNENYTPNTDNNYRRQEI